MLLVWGENDNIFSQLNINTTIHFTLFWYWSYCIWWIVGREGSKKAKWSSLPLFFPKYFWVSKSCTRNKKIKWTNHFSTYEAVVIDRLTILVSSVWWHGLRMWKCDSFFRLKKKKIFFVFCLLLLLLSFFLCGS